MNAPLAAIEPTAFAHITWRGRNVRIEHRWIAPGRTDRPLLVFLHEGLGSVSMWRDFPERLCEAAKLRGLVYSRPGYGRSTPRAPRRTAAHAVHDDQRGAGLFLHHFVHLGGGGQ